MSDMVDRIAGLSEDARALLDLLLKEAEAAIPPKQLIVPRSTTTPSVASFAQQRLWFLHQLDSDSRAYTMPIALRLTGALDVLALQRSLNMIVERHEVLRTTFVQINGTLHQVIAPALTIGLPLVDLQACEATERAALELQQAREEGQRPFDLAAGPLVRATLLRLAPQSHTLLLTLHHIIADGWSLSVLVKELVTFYTSIAQGLPLSEALPALPTQYADYALWQRQRLQGSLLEQQLAYWKARLGPEGSTPVLELPTDRARPPVQTFNGATHPFAVTRSLTSDLHTLSQRENVTLFMLLLAAFQTLLYRYTHQPDIIVGSPVAGRTQVETEQLIGCFVNPLAFRTDLTGNPTFRELLGRVREVTLGALAHQDLPFEQLVQELHGERDRSRSPIFQVLLVLQNTPQAHLELPHLTLSVLDIDRGTAKFDLTLELNEQPGGLQGIIEYNTDLFDAPTITRLAGHFVTLLQGIVAQPDQRLHDLPLLTPSERRQQLIEWNSTAVAFPQDDCLHTLVAAQAARSPDAIAVVAGDQAISYYELDERANQLAAYLRGRGVGPEVRVGLCVERTLDLVVGMLGILKAGGAYVPLDPAYPQERLQLILQDAQAPVVLTQQRLSERLSVSDVQAIYLDRDWSEIAQAAALLPQQAIVPDHLAYVIYTSGSTGRPKGVTITHRSASSLIHWAHTVYDAADLAGVLAATSICFDLSVFELFVPLSCGGRVILAENVLHLPAAAAEQTITLVNTVPSAMAELLRATDLPASVRVVNLAGEPLPHSLVQRLYQHTTLKHVYNLYGPSEDTTYSTFTRVDPDASTPPTIGRPIANTQAYLLDPQMQPVPIGASGELYLGGAGLARGYLNRPDLTAEKFIPDWFSGRPGDRLYKTGDLARYLPDGTLDFLGRADHQVKVRGFRIELGEIEAALAQHPAVRDVVVLAREDTPGDKRLVAYVVGENLDTQRVPGTKNQDVEPDDSRSSVLGSAELRQFLKERLPDYMVPSVFVLLDALPLTPNGKLDRRALPLPDAQRLPSDALVVAPRTPIEELLAGCWATLLGVNPIGVHNNFFVLGGHSLLATQVVAWVRATFQVELPLRAIFDLPTIAELASWIAAQSSRRRAIPPIERYLHTNPLPLSFAQQRLWFLDQLEPSSPFYNVPAAVRLSGSLNLDALRQSLDEIVQRHEVLRTIFTPGGALTDGQPQQVILPAEPIYIPISDLSLMAAEDRMSEALRLAHAEARRPFDLRHGPLMRATLLRLDDSEHVLLLTLHHIVCDGWALNLLIHELSVCYTAAVKGIASGLPELPIQYADYAIWQRHWLQGEVFAAQLEYWRRQLADAPKLLALPTDRTRPAIQTFNGATQSFMVPDQIGQQLIALSRDAGVTLFMTLLAAFQALLYRYTNQQDIVVGTPIANRAHVETESLIGFFTNTLALRSRLTGSTAFRDLLHQVREVALDAYAHQDLPFEYVIDELNVSRDLAHSPLFQVMFVLQNTVLTDLDLPDLRLCHMPIDSQTAKFDLTLFIRETEQGLACAIEYNTDLFDSATIERLAGHFQMLLQGIVADPAQRVADLPLLTDAEQMQIRGWNATSVTYANAGGVHDWFAMQVAQRPESTALVCGTAELSYAALQERSLRLARLLRARGVGPDMRVGICVERTLDLVVGVLGILQAGGAYVPLDPAYPRDRLAFMLQDSQAHIVVTHERLAAQIPDQGLTLVYLDQADAAPGGPVAALPSVTPDHLAYVIYTSGSTGWPKGVAMRHGALANLIAWQLEHTTVSAGAKTLQFASLSFDVSFQEIFATLCAGGTLVLIDDDQRRDPRALLQFLLERSIERLFLPFVALQQLAEAVGETSLADAALREVITAGEQLQISQPVSAFFERLPRAVLYNHYGPSETHVVTSYLLQGGSQQWSMLPPIGHPIANTQIYLLDEYQRLVPIGVPGEIYIGGEQLARGYLNRPALTAEAFVPDPFSAGYPPGAGARLYRTGDLARYLPDGAIEFLGRRDHQVKIRGFRIDPGEIETALTYHPGIAEAVVQAYDNVGHKQLVAYVVGSQEYDASSQAAAPVPGPTELRSFLKERLPAYMIPTAFVVLETLPLTPSGKIDRKALPLPDAARPELDVGHVAPRTPTEELVAGIWCRTLGLHQVGVVDDFFALGGHSLLATQVIAQIRATFQVELPLRSLFETPTISGLAAQIEERLAGNQQLLVPAIEPLPRDQPLPLSFAQYRLWFLDQLTPGNSTYNIPLVLRLEGQLDTRALAQSLDLLVQRHETLRTTFGMAQDEPIQLIGPAQAFPLILTSLREIPDDQREAALHERLSAEARQPFDLQHGPLARAMLIAIDSTTHVLLLTLHHIIADAWSLGVLVQDLVALYPLYTQQPQTEKASLGPRVAPLPIQYADYAAWQRRWLQGEALEQQLDYWRRQLGSAGTSAPPVLELPTDRPRPAAQTFNGAAETIVIPPSLHDALLRLSERENVTLFMTLLAAFQTLLYRYSGQTDLAVGSPIANRTRAETEPLIGCFVNTLVLRTDLSGNPAFRDLLYRVRDVALDAYTHQDLPFEKLVEALQPSRDLSHSPLFQVMFVLQNAPIPTIELPGLTLRRVDVETKTAQFDLQLAVVPTDGELHASLTYNTDLFDASTIARMLAHFQRLLDAIVADPAQRLLDLPLLSSAERQQILAAWNATAIDYPTEPRLHDLIAAQVIRTPDAVAVVFEDQQLSYAELNRRANQLAHHLRSLGVKPDGRVGVCLERSLDLVIALVAILKAGGAYVPLDPTYPLDRLQFMVRDAQVPVLLTTTALAERVSASGARLVCLDTAWPAIARESAAAPETGAEADNLAYMIYTSGSTGQPKGAMNTHRAIVNRLLWMQDVYQLTAADRVLQKTPFSFDVSVWEFFWPLMTGATLVVARPEGHKDSAYLVDVIQRERITTLHFVPSMLQVFLDAEDVAGCTSLRQVICSGEALPGALRDRFFTLLHADLHNLYGPTEAAVDVSYWPCTQERERAAVPIGYPIANTQLYVLDVQLQPVPIGVVGELYIGGVQLARGYFNRPDLTAEKFIPNPFSSTPGARLYRTGDLARYLPGGELLFLGRIDHQVKLRGFRIELGEIEAALARHDTIREAVVIVREDRPGDKRLVAYVVPTKEQRAASSPADDAGSGPTDGLCSPQELHSFLQQRLPEYMVPSAFVILDTLPRLPNGKVNHKALAAPDRSRVMLPDTYIAPGTSTETTLAAIWMEILGLERIGIHDNFFEIGGHSLLATQVISRIRKAYAVHLPLRSFFEQPTIAGLATAIDQHQLTSAPRPAPKIQVSARRSQQARRVLNTGEQPSDSEVQHMLQAKRTPATGETPDE